MANLMSTLSWGSTPPANAAARLERWTAREVIRPLNSRRLGLLLIFTFCAIAGARPVVARSEQQPIVTGVFLPVRRQRATVRQLRPELPASIGQNDIG
jgi:hypothetical protein